MQQKDFMRGTQPQYVGRFTFYITPGGELIVAMGNRHLKVTPDEARGLFDFLLLYARFFEQASNGHTGNIEPLRMEQHASSIKSAG